MGRPRVSDELYVVTVTYSPGPHLDRFLASLAHATERPVTVLMADNGSTDGAPEEAVERYPNARLLRMGGNLGYGSAINRAVAIGRARSPQEGLASLEELAGDKPMDFLPFHAACADLLARAERHEEARRAYDAALALDPEAAEARFLEARRDALPG